MSAKDLLGKIIQDKNMNYELLSKELEVSMQTLYNLRNENIKNISINLLNKIANYTGDDLYLVAYKCLASRDASKFVDENALMHLSKKYCSGLGIDIKNSKNRFLFCGAHYKKRTNNSYSLVDGWKSLEIQFWKSQYKFSEPKPEDIFLNEDVYYRAVLRYGISKAQYVDDKKVINYEIVFQDETIYEKIKELIPKRMGFNLNLVFEPVDDSLRFDQLVSIDNEDISFFTKIYRYPLRYYNWGRNKPSKDLWIAAFEANKVIIPYVQPNIEYAQKRLYSSDYKNLITMDEERNCTPEECLQKYLDRKIECLKNDAFNLIDLNYTDYQIVLRPIDATLNKNNVSIGEYKKILNALNPLIEGFYKNSNEEVDYPLFME